MVFVVVVADVVCAVWFAGLARVRWCVCVVCLVLVGLCCCGCAMLVVCGLVCPVLCCLSYTVCVWLVLCVIDWFGAFRAVWCVLRVVRLVAVWCLVARAVVCFVG